jgi:hypothetical protein
MTFTHRLIAVWLPLLIGGCAAAAPPSGVGVTLSCADFRHKPDGAWVAVRRTKIVGPKGPFTVEPGEIFRLQFGGTTNYGVKVAETLDESCR